MSAGPDRATPPAMLVVATAGHVDHGKSTLVRALTGMEPDRWAAERRRGMTIDLGFAWTGLPGGATVAFVDVPGHERFLGNMLAGLGPAPAVLFVVAADEGWRAQSAEHLAAADALAITDGLLVITRSDLTDPATTAATAAAARAELARTTLGAVPTVAVSARTGAGLPELRAALAALAARMPPARPAARVRMWVDRAFTVRGHGTVVTGTLTAGTLTVGDEVEVAGRRLRVRGLQSLGRPVVAVRPPARVAVNLRGIDPEALRRGSALLSPGAWIGQLLLDVRLSVEADHWPERVHLHLGTADLIVHLRPLGDRLARLTRTVPLPVAVGDRGLLRDPGGAGLLAGIEVLDPDPPPLARRGAARRRATDLADLAAAADRGAAAWIAQRGAVRRSDLLVAGFPAVKEGTAELLEVVGWLISPAHHQHWLTSLRAAADAAARTDPLDPWMPADTARRAAELPDPALLAPLATAAGLLSTAGRWHRPGVQPNLGSAEIHLGELERGWQTEPFQAPEQGQLDRLGLGERQLSAAATLRRVVRLPGGVILPPDAPARARQQLRALPAPFTLSAARQSLRTTRRVAVPLLELLDRLGWTRRVDATGRVVLDRPEPRSGDASGSDADRPRR